MFFKKKIQDLDVTEPDIAIETIPPEFYGEADPEVKFKTKSNFGAISHPPAAASFFRLNRLSKGLSVVFSSRKFLIIGAVSLFLVFCAVTALYYWQQLKPSALTPTVATVPTNQAQTDAKVENVAEKPVPLPPPPAENINEITPPPQIISTSSLVFTENEAKPVFPSLLVSNAVDSEKDGLTDPEEEFFNTSSTLEDSDGDRYSDSQEIYNLYSPAEGGEAKLSDSTLIKVFSNSVYEYSLFYPASWVMGDVGGDSKDMLFSTFTGENIEVRVYNKPVEQSFEDWFSVNAPGEKLADLLPFSSVFKVNGWQRQDHLVYYFPWQTKIIILLYHTDNSVCNYPGVIKMMARSFKFSDSTAVIPSREVEAGEQPLIKPAGE